MDTTSARKIIRTVWIIETVFIIATGAFCLFELKQYLACKVLLIIGAGLLIYKTRSWKRGINATS